MYNKLFLKLSQKAKQVKEADAYSNYMLRY